MQLNVNSPAYYTQQFGVVDEIYNMCKELRIFFKDKTYSPEINTIGIIPIVAPKDLIEKGHYKENKKCEMKFGFASVSLQIDYDEFINADVAGKQKLVINNILASVKSIHKKAKVDYVSFERDIMRYCQDVNIIFD